MAITVRPSESASAVADIAAVTAAAVSMVAVTITDP
jgi:hypothetical protein